MIDSILELTVLVLDWLLDNTSYKFTDLRKEKLLLLTETVFNWLAKIEVSGLSY